MLMRRARCSRPAHRCQGRQGWAWGMLRRKAREAARLSTGTRAARHRRKAWNRPGSGWGLAIWVAAFTSTVGKGRDGSTAGPQKL